MDQFGRDKSEGASNAVDVVIGAAVYERRLQIKMLLEDLSIATGIDAAELDAYEKGHLRISASTLIGICRALEMSPADLFVKIRS